jgi:tripartite-type tricarboxylate transporter receptor subunit TctC
VGAKLLAARLKTRLHDAFWPAITFTRPAGWRSSDRRRGLVIDRGETVMPSIRIIAALAALAAASTSAGAQDWPSRPLTMVYPFAAGSAADALGRMFASRLSEILGQQVIFENVSGAGGMLGSNRVAKAAPDGYQFVLGGTFMVLNQSLYKNPLYNAATDFAPVALIVDQPIVLIVRKDLPAGNLPEFIAYAKANEARLQYGSGGVASMPHLACELLNAKVGVKITHVPYRGGAPLMQDLLSSRIDYLCGLPPNLIPQIESHAVKAIAIFSKSRLPALPNLATAHEEGLADFEIIPWYAFFLPKGTPAQIVRRLREATVATMETLAIQEKLKQLGYTLVPPERRSSDYLKKFVEAEIDRWAVVIKAAEIAPQ